MRDTVTDRSSELGPRTRRFLEATEGERGVRIRTLALLVLGMSLLNSLLVPLVSAHLAHRMEVPRLTPLIGFVATVIGGGFLSWGLDTRRRWAWTATMLAFGSLFVGTLLLGAFLRFRSVGEGIFLTLVAMPFSLLPLLLIWRDRRLFLPPDSGEDEEFQE